MCIHQFAYWRIYFSRKLTFLIIKLSRIYISLNAECDVLVHICKTGEIHVWNAAFHFSMHQTASASNAIAFYCVFGVDIVVLLVFAIKCCAYELCHHATMPTFVHEFMCVQKSVGFRFCARHLVSFATFFLLNPKSSFILFFFCCHSSLCAKLMICSILFEVHKFNQLLPRILLTKRKRWKKKKQIEIEIHSHTNGINGMKWKNSLC